MSRRSTRLGIIGQLLGKRTVAVPMNLSSSGAPDGAPAARGGGLTRMVGVLFPAITLRAPLTLEGAHTADRGGRQRIVRLFRVRGARPRSGERTRARWRRLEHHRIGSLATVTSGAVSYGGDGAVTVPTGRREMPKPIRGERASTLGVGSPAQGLPRT